MNTSEVFHWVEEHPIPSIVIGAGGLIAILYLLGYFSPSSSGQSGQSAGQNLAAAYYTAEANQADVGGAIQVAQIQANADEAVTASNNSAAVAINNVDANAAQTMNGQNVNGALGLGGQELQATYSNNATAANIATTNAGAVTTLGAQQAAAYNAMLGAAENITAQQVALGAYQSDLLFQGGVI
jgi:hypothetical protein